MCECGDGPSTYRESRPKARKAHTCSECRGTINAGETYRQFWGVWDGEANTYRTCDDCLALEGWAHDECDCFCSTFGNLHSDVLDMVHESGLKDLIAEGEKRVREVRAKRRQPVAA